METVQRNIKKIPKNSIWQWTLLIYFVYHVFVSLASAQENFPEVVIVGRNDVQYTGRLLYAADNALILWQSAQPYNKNKINEFAKKIHSSEINRIVIKRKSKFLQGFVYGLVIGGACGALYSLTQRDNEEGQIFWTMNTGQKALKKGLKLGVPSAVIGGIIGASLGNDDDFFIAGNRETYKTVVRKLKKKSLFPDKAPAELRAFIM